MKQIFTILGFLNKFYWIKKRTVFLYKKYLFKYHILPIIMELNDEKVYENNVLTLKDAILSEPFKNGIIDYFLRPNDYILNTKDVAVCLNMALSGHSSELFIKSSTIDASIYLTKKIKERFISDNILKSLLTQLGKATTSIDTIIERMEIEKIFDDKKLLFANYFNIYHSKNYSEIIKIYYPGYGKNWVEWNENESLEIRVYKHDIPRGFFLVGFDYKSNKLNWLNTAIQTNKNEYFNSTNEMTGKIVWQR